MVRAVLFLLPLFAAASAAGATFRCAMERVVSMDPLRAASVCDARAVGLVYEPLLEVDYRARPYTLRPGLCKLPTLSADGLTYTFRLRDEAAFMPDPCFGPEGKGRPVTAQDVVYSLTRLGDKANASSGLWTVQEVAKTEALDDRTVAIVLKKPLHVFPWLMALDYAAVVPREAVEKYGVRFGSHPVGTGPYRLAAWRRNHRMTFERNPAWPGWRAASPVPGTVFDTVEYFVVDDVTTMWLMFLAGEVDYLGGVPRDNWDAVADAQGALRPELAARGIRLHANTTLTVMYAGINMRDPVLGPNRKLRQALNCAFDFPAWKRFCNNLVEPADGPLPRGVEGRLETPFAYAFDLEKAKRLVAEAGYPNGVDPATGKRLVLTISVGRATQDAREQVELMQSFYAKIGIRLEAQYMTWDAYLKAVNEGRTQIFFLGWVGDYPDAENFLQLFYSKNASPGANHGNYVNPAFDRAYLAAMAARTPEARNVHWRAAQEIVREDCPWIFFHYPRQCSLVRDTVRGYKPTDFPYGMEKHLRSSAK